MFHSCTFMSVYVCHGWSCYWGKQVFTAYFIACSAALVSTAALYCTSCGETLKPVKAQFKAKKSKNRDIKVLNCIIFLSLCYLLGQHSTLKAHVQPDSVTGRCESWLRCVQVEIIQQMMPSSTVYWLEKRSNIFKPIQPKEMLHMNNKTHKTEEGHYISLAQQMRYI